MSSKDAQVMAPNQQKPRATVSFGKVGQLLNYAKLRLQQLRMYWTVCASYWYDSHRYIRWSFNSALDDPNSLDKRQMQALLTKGYHVVEKGLAFRTPRPGFGRAHVAKLLTQLQSYLARFGSDDTSTVTVNVLESYYRFNLAQGLHDSHLEKAISDLHQKSTFHLPNSNEGGVKSVTRDQILADCQLDLTRFFASRHSVRDFAAEPVAEQAIRAALEMARHTPSVCNRQAWNVHVYSDASTKRIILEHQNGNRGFGDSIDKLLLITSDLRAFTSAGERNQAWIDGGMFSMSLIYALHSLGLGTCCLNWCAQPKQDRALHQVLGTPESELIIMLIGVGQLPSSYKVTASQRKAMPELLNWY